MEIKKWQQPILTHLSQLESSIKNIPSAGTFSDVNSRFSIKNEDLPFTIQLKIAPWEQTNDEKTSDSWTNRRYFEVKVTSQNFNLDSAEWIWSGTTEELKTFIHEKNQVLEKIQSSIADAIHHIERNSFNLG